MTSQVISLRPIDPLSDTIQRLEHLLDQETAALHGSAAIDLSEFNKRKDHSLLELTRAVRIVDIALINDPMRARFKGLQHRLEANRAVLKLQLDAVREISSIVGKAIQDAESDGTYGQSILRSRPRP